jgi:mono/diheme cytochrome c family protein
MKTLAIAIAFAAAPLLSAPTLAGPFDKGNIEEGKATHEEKCNGCHAAKFGGDGTKIYTRADRRVKTPSGLSQMITTCNAMLGNNLFPEDELHLAAYLNNQFYKFK